MKAFAMVAIAAGLASLAACQAKQAANTDDNLTEGIVINNAEVYANDANTTDSNTGNAVVNTDEDALNANANAAANNAQ